MKCSALFNPQFVSSIGPQAGIIPAIEGSIFYRQIIPIHNGAGGTNYGNGIPLQIPLGFYFKLSGVTLRANSTLDYALALSMSSIGQKDFIINKTINYDISNFNGPIIWWGFNAIALAFTPFPFVNGDAVNHSRAFSGLNANQIVPGGMQLNFALATNDSSPTLIIVDAQGTILKDSHRSKSDL